MEAWRQARRSLIHLAHHQYEQFLKKLGDVFPQASETMANSAVVIKPEVISPFALHLTSDILALGQRFIKSLFASSIQSEYLASLPEEWNFSDAKKIPSLLTCFDFHYSPDYGLKLIEVNTNASLCLPFVLLRECHNIAPVNSAPLNALLKEFTDCSATLSNRPLTKVAIVDVLPKEEGLYFEFLMYKNWLEQNKISTSIMSLDEFNNSTVDFDLVYNRSTDFYLSDKNSVKLKELFNSNDVAVSPNPWGYYSLADKRRLPFLKKYLQSTSQQDLAEIIPGSQSIKNFSSLDEVWQNRKKFFFKPSSSYGGKAAFAGKGISRKMFDSICEPELIVQDFIPAGKQKFDFQDQTIEHKFDLRFYANSQEIIEVGARLYQGQTTNMRTQYGGIAPIAWE